MDSQNDYQIRIGAHCYLDVFRETLVKDGLPIALSRTQFRIIYLLAQNLGQPVLYRDLILYAWGDAECCRNDLYVYINRIRQRLEKHPKSPQHLLSVRGVGYVLYADQG